MNKIRKFSLAFLVGATILITGCSDSGKKMGELSAVQMESVVKNLPMEDSQLLKDFIGKNQLEGTLTQHMGSAEEKKNFKPYTDFSIDEAISLEKKVKSEKKK